MAACLACDAPIFWIFTAAGRRMPLDKVPSGKGTVWIDSRGTGQNVGADNPAPTGAPLYVSHFATCPKAASFRRR